MESLLANAALKVCNCGIVSENTYHKAIKTSSVHIFAFVDIYTSYMYTYSFRIMLQILLLIQMFIETLLYKQNEGKYDIMNNNTMKILLIFSIVLKHGLCSSKTSWCWQLTDISLFLHPEYFNSRSILPYCILYYLLLLLLYILLDRNCCRRFSDTMYNYNRYEEIYYDSKYPCVLLILLYLRWRMIIYPSTNKKNTKRLALLIFILKYPCLILLSMLCIMWGLITILRDKQSTRCGLVIVCVEYDLLHFIFKYVPCLLILFCIERCLHMRIVIHSILTLLSCFIFCNKRRKFCYMNERITYNVFCTYDRSNTFVKLMITTMIHNDLKQNVITPYHECYTAENNYSYQILSNNSMICAGCFHHLSNTLVILVTVLLFSVIRVTYSNTICICVCGVILVNHFFVVNLKRNKISCYQHHNTTSLIKNSCSKKFFCHINE